MADEHRSVGLFGMVVMGFFWVCGGMYGNEELLGTARMLGFVETLSGRKRFLPHIRSKRREERAQARSARAMHSS